MAKELTSRGRKTAGEAGDGLEPDDWRLLLAGDLAERLARLDACGSGAERLVIARRCLAARPEDRFAAGRAVAAAVASYRAKVEARLRQADTAAAEALVREAEQRKRRRLTLMAGVDGVVLASDLGLLSVLRLQTVVWSQGLKLDLLQPPVSCLRSCPTCSTPMKFVQAVPRKLTVSTQATWMPAQASFTSSWQLKFWA